MPGASTLTRPTHAGDHGGPGRPGGRGRRSRWARRAVVALVSMVALLYAAVGWYVSGEMIAALRVEPPSPVQFDTDVLAIEGGDITLRRPDEASRAADRDAVMGVTWEAGYGQVGPAHEVDGDIEVRPLTVLVGSPPPVGSAVVDVDPFAFSPDPSVLGLDVEVVTYPSPLGELEAWLFPGPSSTWLIAVHGVSADRHEFLRLVDATHHLGYPTLVVRYRNDPGAPATDGSLILVGQEEWPDVEAAISYAVGRGATDVVLVGASMGGGLVLSQALEGDASLVRGLILESANVDVRETIRLRSGDALPVGGVVGDSILAVGRAVAWLRTGLDFDAVDYIERADELSVPTLLLHGTDDHKIPVEVAEGFAEARPDLVEYHRIEGGGHVRAWNEDPAGYASVVEAFLQRVAPRE
jgi:uncharacterized protein